MKTFIVFEVQGGVPSDPEIFLDRTVAILRYIECVKGWAPVLCQNQTAEGNTCEHQFPYPALETFEFYFTEVICPDCGGEVDLSALGHGDNDLYFYDGIDVECAWLTNLTDAAILARDLTILDRFQQKSEPPRRIEGTSCKQCGEDDGRHDWECFMPKLTEALSAIPQSDIQSNVRSTDDA